MQPNRLGRILGISARVAADKLRERTTQATAQAQRLASTSPAPARTAPPTTSVPTLPASASLAEGSRRLARGAGRFGASMWRPFVHAAGVLTLQITGVLFALFTLFFIVHFWQIYKAAGWRDHHLPLYAAFAVLFAWFAVSSFWRASRKQKRA